MNTWNLERKRGGKTKEEDKKTLTWMNDLTTLEITLAKLLMGGGLWHPKDVVVIFSLLDLYQHLLQSRHGGNQRTCITTGRRKDPHYRPASVVESKGLVCLWMLPRFSRSLDKICVSKNPTFTLSSNFQSFLGWSTLNNNSRTLYGAKKFGALFGLLTRRNCACAGTLWRASTSINCIFTLYPLDIFTFSNISLLFTSYLSPFSRCIILYLFCDSVEMGETQQSINLSNLSLDQLSGLKQQVEEVSFLIFFCLSLSF